MVSTQDLDNRSTAMQIVIVLFNLKPGVPAEKYETWAKTIDIPTVSALASVERFETLRTSGVLGGGDSPYQYIEVIRIRESDQFSKDLASDAMRALSASFQQFADNPLFLTTTHI
jgi:hypothetical protein